MIDKYTDRQTGKSKFCYKQIHFEHSSIAEALPYVLLFIPLVPTVMGLTVCNCFVSEDTGLLF